MYHGGVPLLAIQAMMGHDSIADTSIYIHVSDKLKNRSNLKESSIFSCTSTNIYLLVNRFLHRIGRNVSKLSFTIFTDNYFSWNLFILMQTVKK
jgi:NifB/MoaA-like Fe-S oxidoreductase